MVNNKYLLNKIKTYNKKKNKVFLEIIVLKIKNFQKYKLFSFCDSILKIFQFLKDNKSLLKK